MPELVAFLILAGLLVIVVTWPETPRPLPRWDGSPQARPDRALAWLRLYERNPSLYAWFADHRDKE